MHQLRVAAVAAVALVAMLALTSVASAAHLGNSKAELGGTLADPDAVGTATVNYSKGQEDFNGRTTVRNLNPGAFYTFVVRNMMNEATDQIICSGFANRQGTFSCSEQHLVLGGFSEAVIEDMAGNDVAIGTFDRRGNCREPDQAGSQCQAPGQTG